MNQLSASQDNGSLIESVIVKGDLASLTPADRTRYYVKVCESVGLNPLTRPFEYLTLNGKLVLYATRACTDQLRAIQNVSVVSMEETERDSVYIVTVQVRNDAGRTDMAKGAVTLGSLKGDALANMIMKCETKAKRRATLSICGLGFLDELEVETTPAERMSAYKAKGLGKQPIEPIWEQFMQEIGECETAFAVENRAKYYREKEFPTWPKGWPENAEEEIAHKLASFSAGGYLGQTLRDSVDEETGEIIAKGPPHTPGAEAIRDELVERIEAMGDAEDLRRLRDRADFKSALARLPEPMQVTVRRHGAAKLKALPAGAG